MFGFTIKLLAMKKTILILSIAGLLISGISCKGTNSKNHVSGQTATTVYYTCRMHPAVHLYKPGNCPKCGMELIQKEEPKSDTTKVIQKLDSTKLK